VVTAANVHDKHPLPDSLHGREQRIYGHCAYASQSKLIHTNAPGAGDLTDKTVRKSSLTEGLERTVNRAKSRVRSRVEHVIAVVQRLWGLGKVRYCGLAKNATRAFVATALANAFRARQRLLA
jgi:IS5 family transposase